MRIWSLSLSQQCHFGITEVSVCGVGICPDRIAIRTVRISIFEDWPTLESVQVLFEIGNCYWQFIKKYAMVTILIYDLLKTTENSRTSKQVKLKWSWDANLTFQT